MNILERAQVSPVLLSEAVHRRHALDFRNHHGHVGEMQRTARPDLQSHSRHHTLLRT